MLLKSLLVLATLFLSIQSQESYHYKDDTYDFYTGYILANGTTDATLFYQLIPAINTTLNDSNPLILWLQGGPGCSSQYGSWIEFGPYYIANVSGTLTPEPRDVNWNQHYHLLLIDNPSNAGFSLPGSANVTDTETAMIQVYNVLTKFFDTYPELSDNDFYIFGESYGGHYVPYIAYEILTRGAKNFNFKGIGIGNAWTDPYVQTATFSDYSFYASLIDRKVRDQLNELETQAQVLIANGNLAGANDIFNQIEANITMKNRTGGVFINDFTSFSDSDPIFGYYGLTEAYLNLPEVKDMYKVPKNINFNLCNGQINAAWAYDQSTNVTDQLNYVLSNTRVMFYSGADDIECNTAGVLKFLTKLDWPGIKDFQKAQRQIWKRSDGYVIGNAKTSTNLTFVTVYKAGHYVPFYQPENALDMVTRFIDGNNNWSEPHLY